MYLQSWNCYSSVHLNVDGTHILIAQLLALHTKFCVNVLSYVFTAHDNICSIQLKVR